MQERSPLCNAVTLLRIITHVSRRAWIVQCEDAVALVVAEPDKWATREVDVYDWMISRHIEGMAPKSDNHYTAECLSEENRR
jgi:hypothetical protein